MLGVAGAQVAIHRGASRALGNSCSLYGEEEAPREGAEAQHACLWVKLARGWSSSSWRWLLCGSLGGQTLSSKHTLLGKNQPTS